jgi:hypothetical protein
MWIKTSFFDVLNEVQKDFQDAGIGIKRIIIKYTQRRKN